MYGGEEEVGGIRCVWGGGRGIRCVWGEEVGGIRCV